MARKPKITDKSGVVKPLTEMTSAQRNVAIQTNLEEAAGKPAVGPKPKLKTNKMAATLPVGTRLAKKKELAKGITHVTAKAPRQRRKKQTPIPVPKAGQIGKLEGKVVRVTPENATQIYEERRRTTLPTATEAEMTPASRPAVEQAIMPKTLRSSQNKKNLGGFARSHKEVSAVTHEALGHLQTMANAEKSSPEFHESHAAFNTLHGQLGQIGNKVLHRDMGLGRTIITQLHGKPGLANALKIHRGVVLGRLEEGKIAEQSRGERAQQGQGGNS